MGSQKMMYVIVIFLLVISIFYVPRFVGEDNNSKKCTWGNCKELIWEESDEYCIFHDPDPNKNRDLFLKELQDRINEGNYDFSGFVFPYILFGDRIFEKHVNFNNAHFYGRINFCNATFENGVSFNGATFHSIAEFDNAVFKNGAPDFADATFEKEARFINTYFEGGGHFVQTTFKDYVFFYGDPDSQEATFGDETDFSKAKFVDEGKVEFRYVIFEGKANFNNTTFSKETKFTYGKFYNTVDFQHSTFEKDLNFKEMIFGVEDNGVQDTEISVTFHEAKFYGETKFDDCVFNVNATFENARFKGDLYIYRAIFNDTNINFSNAKFEQIFVFESKSYENYSVNFISLKYLKVFGQGKIIRTNLEKAIFEKAYLGNVNFIKCEWPDPFIIYEEREEIVDSEDLETIYRELKNSFQKYGQSDYAGKAFYREMEMRRKGTCLNSPLQWAGLHIYYGICGYGERPFRVLMSWIIIILLFSFLFYPFELEIDGHTSYYKFRKILGKTVEFKYFKFCLLYSIVSFSTLGSRYIKPKENASRWLSAIESLIGMFFIALFIYVFARKMLR